MQFHILHDSIRIVLGVVKKGETSQFSLFMVIRLTSLPLSLASVHADTHLV